ncbi:MAG: D-alanyl-D-alanine carboxypeptidase family protein [Deltaproteobacteria bacterium]|nr:D-alanyl-D-alanine carboxypeptidase family protein [Deltaproteobacteria bacterium]
MVASIAALAGAHWLSCTPRRPLDELARLADGLPRVAPSALPALPTASSIEPSAILATPAPSVAPTAAPSAPSFSPGSGPTVAEVLDTATCSTEIVRALSEQIIAEEGCLRPNAFHRLPDKLASASVEEVVFPFLAPVAQEALVEAIESARREPMTINSMLRTIAQQYLLFYWYKRGRCSIKLAASPGRSNHQSGLAIDILQPGRWKSKLSKFGFRWMGAKDKWHFDFVGRDAKEKAQVKRIADAHAGLDVRAFQRLWNKQHPDESLGESGVFDERTETALRRTPVSGFAGATTCGK